MVLVTGGTGFIGAHLLYHLAKNDIKVKALRRSHSNLGYVRKVFGSYGDDAEANELFNQIEWIEADITDYRQLEETGLVPEIIYHCAGFVSFDPSEKQKIFQVNIDGTANILNYALEKGVKKVGYLSSVAALDSVRRGDLVTEKHFGDIPQRFSEYAESKFKAELEVWRGIEEGLNAVIINPSVVIGPVMPEGSIGSIINMLKKGLKYYPTGKTGFTDVRDVVSILLQLMEKEHFNERFIINEGNYAYKELVQKLAEILKVKVPYKPLPGFLTSFAWKWERVLQRLFAKKPSVTKTIHQSLTNQVLFSGDKVRQVLDYEFISFERSLIDTVESRSI
jgi:nucleoside-diphosphate-sugar epimerase